MKIIVAKKKKKIHTNLTKIKNSKKIAIVKNNIAIRIAGKVSRYIDASMNRATPSRRTDCNFVGLLETTSSPLRHISVPGCRRLAINYIRIAIMHLGCVRMPGCVVVWCSVDASDCRMRGRF